MKFLVVPALVWLVCNPLGASQSTDSSVLDRALCQCSTDGKSGGSSALFWSNRGRLYESENIEHGGPYEFIGCGAHKFYRDRSEKQIAGYPWSFCYTFGGTTCRLVETSRRFTLNSASAYRFCDGYYECNARANQRVADGTPFHSQVLQVFSDDGLLQDWTNCCQLCSSMNECETWDFSVETMQCRLFSTTDDLQIRNVDNGSRDPPLWFFGGPGFEDKPVTCWHRNRFETCLDNFRDIFKSALVLLVVGVFFALCSSWLDPLRSSDVCVTDDVTPGPTSNRTVRVSTKNGSHLKTIPTYSATLVFKANGEVKRSTVSRDYRGFKAGKELFFLYAPKEGNRKIILQSGDKPELCRAGNAYLCLPLLAGAILLAIISLQSIATDGGALMAKYVLPGDGSLAGWIFAFLASLLIMIGVCTRVIYVCISCTGRRPVKPENEYSMKHDGVGNHLRQ